MNQSELQFPNKLFCVLYIIQQKQESYTSKNGSPDQNPTDKYMTMDYKNISKVNLL